MDWGGLGWVRVGSLPQKWRRPGLQFLLHCSLFALQFFLHCNLLCIAVLFALQFLFALLEPKWLELLAGPADAK